MKPWGERMTWLDWIVACAHVCVYGGCVCVIELNLLNLANDYARLHHVSQKSDQELKIQLEGTRKDFTRLEEKFAPKTSAKLMTTLLT